MATYCNPSRGFAAEGVDLTDIEVALMLILEGGAADDMLRIDNVYFTAGAQNDTLTTRDRRTRRPARQWMCGTGRGRHVS